MAKTTNTVRSSNLQFNSDEQIQEMIDFIKSNRRKLPQRLDRLETWQDQSSRQKVNWFVKKSERYSVQDDHLYLADKRMVMDKDKRQIMTQLYDDVSKGSGKGIKRFHDMLVDEGYLNISMAEVREFLRDQVPYQMQVPLHFTANRPIVSLFPNDLWGMDCIDVIAYENSNMVGRKKFKYILTIVDIFSNLTYVGALADKSSGEIVRSFKECCANCVFPKHILVDRGTEFYGDFKVFCKDNNIKLRTTSSYSPQSNGVVENKNKQIRKLIRDIFVRTNRMNWIDYTEDIADNLNWGRHGTKKARPIDLWTNTNVPVADIPDNIEPEKRAKQIKERDRMLARQSAFKDKETDLQPGDQVRVAMNALFSKVRKQVKAGIGKSIVVTYSPILFTITRRTTLQNSGGKQIYYVESTRDGIKPNRYFFRSMLVKAGDDEEDDPNITMDRAMVLNQTDYSHDFDNI